MHLIVPSESSSSSSQHRAWEEMWKCGGGRFGGGSWTAKSPIQMNAEKSERTSKNAETEQL